MRNHLRRLIEEAREPGTAVVERSSTPVQERLAADVIRLARVASAVHMASARGATAIASADIDDAALILTGGAR